MNNGSPFSIAGDAPQAGQNVTETDTNLELSERIKNLINSAPIFLFMKGNPAMPQCGFSANVISILSHLGVEFKTFDILSDMDIRQGVKDFTNWPTYPQLYVNGKFIGGNDIITEMFQDGELEAALK